VFFITQNPRDVPAEILGQLGHRVQHALRAFTPDDEKALRSAARTFPKTTFYDVEETLTTLGIGEALVTTLSPAGVPSPPFAVRMVPPSSRMGPLTADELQARIGASEQVRKYAQEIDRESALEMLEARAAPVPEAEDEADDVSRRSGRAPAYDRAPRTPKSSRAADDGREPRRGRKERGTVEQILRSPVAKSAVNTLVRGLVGALLGGRRRR
jgi:hypothetical protein